MTEASWLWTDATGDGGPYDRNDWDDIVQMLVGGIDFTTHGVIAGYENELAVSNPSGKTVRVATGGAIVDGKPYRNTANVDLTPTTPSVGTTGFRVVLRKSWSAQTVRAAIVMNTDGTSAAPAATQTDGTTWEITLATGTITTGDSVSLTDGRSLIEVAPASPRRLVAIGEFSSDGTLSNDYGITSVTQTGTGAYDIVFDEEVKHVFFTISDTSLNVALLDTDLPATTVGLSCISSGVTHATPDRVHVVAYA